MVWLTEVEQNEIDFTPPPMDERTCYHFEKGYTKYSAELEHGVLEYGIIKDNQLIAFVNWRILFDGKNEKVVTPIMVAIQPQYRGDKLGFNPAIELYTDTLEQGYIIQAGDIKNNQSIGGAKLWSKMLLKEEIIITAFSSVFHENIVYDLDIDDSGFLSSEEYNIYGSDAILIMEHWMLCKVFGQDT